MSTPQEHPVQESLPAADHARAAGLGPRRLRSLVVTTLSWVFAAMTLALAWRRFIDTDEIEHVHSAWHVAVGHVPYLDFFQHHHALLWYCLAPFIRLFGESASTLLYLRFVPLLFGVVAVRVTYLTARACGGSREVARLAVLLLLSMTTFAYNVFEIRPDVPQTVFCTISVYYLIRLFRTLDVRHALVSGVAAGVAFLFLQKAIFVFALLPFAMVWALRKDRVILRMGAWWMAGFVTACLPWYVYVAATAGLWSYVQANWLFNLYVPANGDGISVADPFVWHDYVRNAPFWLASAAMAVALVRGRLKAWYAVPAGFGLGLLAFLLASNRAVDRYVVAAVPYLAVAVAGWLHDEFDRRRTPAWAVVIILLGLTILPFVSMVRTLGRTNTAQLERIQYVLDRTKPTDRIMDASRNVNLFRPDWNFYWFMAPAGIRHAGDMARQRTKQGSTCELLQLDPPEVVFYRRSRLERCGLSGLYLPTPYERLFFHATKMAGRPGVDVGALRELERTHPPEPEP